MKRFLLTALVVCMGVAASACSVTMSFPRDDLDEKWGSTPAPSASPVITLAPTLPPEPTAVVETVSDVTLTLSLSFGERTGTYTGEIADGLPHGHGSFKSAGENGTVWIYTGQWEAGHFSGSGTTVWDDGFTETGLYVNDTLNGQGQESWNGVLQYEGSYRNGEYHGQGTLYNSHSEIIYTGAFTDGLMQESAADRASRVGAFKDQTVPLDIGDLYGSCQEKVSMRVEMKGEIFDSWYYPSDSDPYFCDFLIYEQGVQNVERIVCVYYWLSAGETPPADGQSVTVWGTTEYLYTYTTTDGDELTVPLLMAFSIE
jgi:hypothetical protein